MHLCQTAPDPLLDRVSSASGGFVSKRAFTRPDLASLQASFEQVRFMNPMVGLL